MEINNLSSLTKHELFEINGGISGAEFVGTLDDYRTMKKMGVYAVGWVSGFVRGLVGLN